LFVLFSRLLTPPYHQYPNRLNEKYPHPLTLPPQDGIIHPEKPKKQTISEKEPTMGGLFSRPKTVKPANTEQKEGLKTLSLYMPKKRKTAYRDKIFTIDINNRGLR
jgi:hypothetical protein